MYTGFSCPVNKRNIAVGIVFIVIYNLKHNEVINNNYMNYLTFGILTSPTEVASKLTIFSCGTATTL